MEYERLELHAGERHLIMQWFNAVQDLNPEYLKTQDYVLAYKVYINLKCRVPSSIFSNAFSGHPNNESPAYYEGVMARQDSQEMDCNPYLDPNHSDCTDWEEGYLKEQDNMNDRGEFDCETE